MIPGRGSCAVNKSEPSAESSFFMGMGSWQPLFGVTAADPSLRCNRIQRIGELRQDRTEQIQLILGQSAGKRVGDRGDGSRQFTWIHKNLTPISYGGAAGMCLFDGD